MKQVYKTEIRKFFDKEGRFINVDGHSWLACKDMFNWLGRVKADGTWTDERNKLDIFLKNINGECDLKKFRVEITRRNTRSKCPQDMWFIRFDIVERYWNEIKLLFNKDKLNCVELREEYDFINLVKDFFKYDKYISLETQWQIMEFRVDLAIGLNVFVEYDEKHHNNQIDKDIDRMKKIALSQTYRDGYLMCTNDFTKVVYEIYEYNDFTIYDFSGATFIRVHNKTCLTWIPLMYECYAEYMDFLNIKPEQISLKHSNELKKCKILF